MSSKTGKVAEIYVVLDQLNNLLSDGNDISPDVPLKVIRRYSQLRRVIRQWFIAIHKETPKGK